MTDDKLDPRLRDEVARAEHSGDLQRRLPVIIELLASGARGDQDETVPFDDQEGPAERSLRQRLAGIGVSNVQRLPLANALVAEVTVKQLREIAADPSVKRIVSNASQRVAF